MRDPEMHQTRKGKQWYFGMKMHIGVDAESGLIHTIVTIAATVSDVIEAHALSHGEKTTVFGDAGNPSVETREGNRTPGAIWHLAIRLANPAKLMAFA